MPKKVKQKFGPYALHTGGSDEVPELYIYGDIGDNWWDETSTSATQIVQALADIDADEISVYINSYGGSVKEGLAIYNALLRNSAKVSIYIDGIAASMASYIAMAGDTVSMSENGMLMLHAPWGFAMGNAEEMREAADVLDRYADSMMGAYQKQVGADGADDVTDWLKDGKDHWFSAQEAADAGLIDEIDDPVAIAASIRPDRFNNFPAAAAAFIQPKEVKTMPKGIKKPVPAAAVAKPEVDEEAIRAQALADDKVRRADIAAMFRPFANSEDIKSLRETCSADQKCSVESAQKKLLAKLGDGASAVSSPRIEAGESAQEKFVAGAGQALAVRANLVKRDHKDADTSGNEFRSYSLREMARAFLERNNVATGMMDVRSMVGAAFAHSTGDFGNLLQNIAHKAMMLGYDEAAETFQSWTTVGQLGDFKATSRVDLNAYPSLKNKPEGAEYKYASVGDRGEQIQLATYGSVFAITREAIINDDLGAFTRIPRNQGRAAIRTVGDLVYAVLTGNPKMSDNVALFHANHKNLLTGAGMTTSFIDSMRVKMGTQKEGDANLNIRLANLIVPMALEGSANVVRAAEFEVRASSDSSNQRVPNSVRDTFSVISDARLDADSGTTFYSSANSGMHDTIEVAYLDGQEAPYLDQQESWSTDGTKFKVRIDAGVSALDFRTLQKATA